MNTDAQAVLSFWFGTPTTPGADENRPEWFRKDPLFDAQIAERFGALIEAALAGGLQDWAADSQTALARILLLDQFTRNVFRDTARAFAGDSLALAAAREMVERGTDQGLTPTQRWFVYLPFEHAEDLAAQREGLKQFAVLAWQHPTRESAYEWAVKHYDIVLRFGRFPHRNAVLQRASTAEELAFLQQPGSSF
jgi:uncharacterized protein (DUF924 family)